jgi:hypothetical protein
MIHLLLNLLGPLSSAVVETSSPLLITPFFLFRLVMPYGMNPCEVTEQAGGPCHASHMGR